MKFSRIINIKTIIKKNHKTSKNQYMGEIKENETKFKVTRHRQCNRKSFDTQLGLKILPHTIL